MATRTGKSFRQPEDTEECQGDDSLSGIQAPALETPTFPLFPNFPAEIRRMIWLEAIQNDRIVEIGTYDTWRRKVFEVRFTSRTIVPPIVHACSESRSVVTAPGFYEKLIFGGRFTGTYVNWNTDIILFKRPNHINCASRYMLWECNLSNLNEKCRILGVGDAYGLDTMLSRWKLFPNLERIVVIQATESLPGTEIPGDGNLVLLPMSEEQISAFGPWRLHNHRGALERIADFHKKQPRVKQVDLKTAIRGQEKRYTATERAKRWRQVKVIETPKPWKISFKGYRVIDLRSTAVERGLSSDGQKKDLVARLEADEETRFAQAMEDCELETES